MKATELQQEKDRIRKVTDESFNNYVNEKLARKIKLFSNRSPEEISREIDKLDKEWDIERVLQLTTAGFSLISLLAGTKNRRWLFFSGAFAAFLAQHAIGGWAPPVPLLRSFGIRTRQEIDKEKYALKAIRGDFDRMGYANQNNAEVLLDVLNEAVFKD